MKIKKKLSDYSTCVYTTTAITRNHRIHRTMASDAIGELSSKRLASYFALLHAEHDYEVAKTRYAAIHRCALRPPGDDVDMAAAEAAQLCLQAKLNVIYRCQSQKLEADLALDAAWKVELEAERLINAKCEARRAAAVVLK